MPRRLRTVAALCVALAVAGCSSYPPGAGGTLRRLAALDIVTTVPPQAVLVAYEEDLGHAGQGFFVDPSVTVAYATSASIPEVRDFFVGTFPAYDLAEGTGGDAGHTVLTGQDAGTYVEVSISLDAPRYAGRNSPEPSPAPEGADVFVVVDVSPATGVAAPAGSAQIGVVHGDSLVDTDGDGALDAVRMPIAVDVEEPGLYTLVVDIVDANGVKESAQGAATLEAGAGVVNIDLPLDTMSDLGMSGPLTLVNGLLVRGDHGDFLAHASDMGTTAAYDPTSVVAAQHPVAVAPTESGVVGVSGFTTSATDTDGDGVSDTATFYASITVSEAGEYAVVYSFDFPDGSATVVHENLELQAGPNDLLIEEPLHFDLYGAGVYTLSSLSVRRADASAEWISYPDASVYIQDTTN